MKKINIQVWVRGANVWDECPIVTTVDSNEPSVLAQAISDATGMPVRMTFYSDGIEVGKLNGSYFYPKNDE